MARSKSIVSFIFVIFVSIGVRADAPLAERIVKVFHPKDLVFWTDGTPLALETNMMTGDSAGWMRAPLFDGTAGTSVAISWNSWRITSPDGLWSADHPLLRLDSPSIGGVGTAVVGRWAAPSFQTLAQPHIPEIALTLNIEYVNSPAASVVAHMANIGDSSTPFQDFRLPIAASTSPVKSLRLVLSAAWGVPLIIEDVRLVEPGGDPRPIPGPPASGLPPAGESPVSTNSVTQFDFVPWVSGQGGQAPVVISDMGNYIYAVRFERRPDDGLPRRVSLISIDAPPLAAGDFGTIGTINYAGLDGKGDFDGSAYFELTALYPDGTGRVVGTTAAFGPCQKITGHSANRTMEIALHSAMQPARLQLQLIADGIGQIGLSDFSFVQFVPPTPTANLAGTSRSLPWTDQRLIRGAGWSVAVASLLLAAVVVLMPRFSPARAGGLIALVVMGEGLFAWAMFLLGRGEAFVHVTPLFAGAAAWALPLLARRLVFRRLQKQELRKMFTIDAV